MNNLDKQYTDLLQTILDYGIEKKDRTGTGTKSIFGYTIRHNMKDGFPLLTTKKMYTKGIITELLWFLRGDTNIKFLVDNDCHIWDGDAWKTYLKNNKDLGADEENASKEWFVNKIKKDDYFASVWGELGPVYGKQWRSWNGNGSPLTKDYEGNISSYLVKPVDQIANLINDLKTNPDSRRLMVNAWNVGELDQMTLPPCHYGFQVYTRELSREERFEIHRKYITKDRLDLVYELATNENLDKLGVPTRAISLMWNQRSVDTFLGLPFNIASYGLLLEIIAKAVNMVPEELIGNLGDTHLYLNHIEQAKEQIGQPIFEESPTIYPNGPMNEGIKKQIIVGHTREPYPLPKLVINDEFWNPDAGIFEQIEHIEISDFDIRDYQSHPTIKAPLSN